MGSVSPAFARRYFNSITSNEVCDNCRYKRNKHHQQEDDEIRQITPKAVFLLSAIARQSSSEWVFVGNDGKRLSYEALRWQTKCACRDAGIEYRGKHVFRHTFATNCYYKGMDIKILSRLLGHADVNITYNIYIHLYGDGFDEMYEALCK